MPSIDKILWEKSFNSGRDFEMIKKYINRTETRIYPTGNGCRQGYAGVIWSGQGNAHLLLLHIRKKVRAF